MVRSFPGFVFFYSILYCQRCIYIYIYTHTNIVCYLFVFLDKVSFQLQRNTYRCLICVLYVTYEALFYYIIYFGEVICYIYLLFFRVIILLVCSTRFSTIYIYVCVCSNKGDRKNNKIFLALKCRKGDIDKLEIGTQKKKKFRYEIILVFERYIFCPFGFFFFFNRLRVFAFNIITFDKRRKVTGCKTRRLNFRFLSNGMSVQ